MGILQRKSQKEVEQVGTLSVVERITEKTR